jgi:hypothetical protein
MLAILQIVCFHKQYVAPSGQLRMPIRPRS